MNKKFQIVLGKSNSEHMVIHPAYVAMFEDHVNQRINLRFGPQTLNLPFSFSSHMRLDQITLPHSVIKSLKIPLSSCYQIKMKRNLVHLVEY